MTRSRKSSLSRSLKAVIQSPNISRTNTKQKPLSEDDKIILLTWAENDPDNPMNVSKFPSYAEENELTLYIYSGVRPGNG